MKIFKDLFSSFLILSLFLISCAKRETNGGETHGDVIEKNRAQATEVRTQLKKWALVLPQVPRDIIPEKCEGLKPKFVFDIQKNNFNADIMLLEEVLNPDEKPLFPLYLSEVLKVILNWTGPKNPLRVMDRETDDLFRDKFKRAFNLNYLVVLNNKKLVLPKAIDNQTFQPGWIETEVLILDFKTQKILCASSLMAQSDKKIDYLYRPGEDTTLALAKWARSNLSAKIRAHLGVKLSMMTDSPVVIKK